MLNLKEIKSLPVLIWVLAPHVRMGEGRGHLSPTPSIKVQEIILISPLHKVIALFDTNKDTHHNNSIPKLRRIYITDMIFSFGEKNYFANVYEKYMEYGGTAPDKGIHTEFIYPFW